MAKRPVKAGLVFAGVLGLTSSVCSAQTVVRIAPPAPQSVVVVGRAPGPKYVWTGGYYRWNGNHYVWVGGRWIVPPRPGAVWVAPRWIPRNGGYIFVAGSWR
jgi:WXXGXW repeat (2 copies)